MAITYTQEDIDRVQKRYGATFEKHTETVCFSTQAVVEIECIVLKAIL